jgi:serine/threonine-protein kinase ATR
MRVCEITLGVLRSHREALMSVLETFVHDPLVGRCRLTLSIPR